MNSCKAIGVSVVVGLLMVGSVIAGDTTTSPGRNSVHVSTIAVALPAGVETVMLAGTIVRGKHGQVLTVDASVGSVAPGEAGSFRPRVNGVAFETTDDFGTGSSASIICASPGVYGCTGTGHWWIDLDAAEAAHPGTFIGKPLSIELVGGGLGGPIGVSANMSARLEKK